MTSARANQDALDDQEATVDKRIRLIDKIGGYASEVESAFAQIKANSIDAEIQNTQLAYDNELKSAGDSAEEKLRVQKKYDKELKRLAFERAKAERDNAVASVAISTAVGIAKAFAQFGFPGGIVPAAIVAIQGGLQTAAIYSRPLPAYFRGRQGGIAELAEVSERGPELIKRAKTGNMEYVAERAIVPLGAGDDVYSAHQTTEMLRRAGLNHQQAQQPAQLAAAFGGAAQSARESREAAQGTGIEALAKGQHEIAEALRKFKPTVVNVHRGSDADVQTSNSLTHYMSQLQFKKL